MADWHSGWTANRPYWNCLVKEKTMACHSRSILTGRIALLAALPVLLAAAITRADFAQNFDAVVAPALPSGWTSASFGITWKTTTDNPDSPPNCANASTLDHVGEGYLDSPPSTSATRTTSCAFDIDFNSL